MVNNIGDEYPHRPSFKGSSCPPQHTSILNKRSVKTPDMNKSVW